MKNVIFLSFVFFGLISCSQSKSQECEYLDNMGKKSYDQNNQNIKALNIKIHQCKKDGNGFLGTKDPECIKKVLQEFSEQNNCG